MPWTPRSFVQDKARKERVAVIAIAAVGGGAVSRVLDKLLPPQQIPSWPQRCCPSRSQSSCFGSARADCERLLAASIQTDHYPVMDADGPCRAGPTRSEG